MPTSEPDVPIAAVAAPDPGFTLGTILLVEDDPGDALLVEELLADDLGHHTFTWVRDLAATATAVRPDVRCILLDLGLPDAEGLAGLQAVLDLAPQAAVVVLTGFDDRSRGAAAVALGAQDYLVKGAVDSGTLSRSIRYAIERKRGELVARQLSEAALLAAENTRLERGLLPKPLIRRPDLPWATRYEPGGGRALLGGDFFDAVELDDGTVRILVGDVCGHGPDEAALGVALRVAWRTLVLAGIGPGEVLGRLQHVLIAERFADHVFATACDLTLEPDLTRAHVRLAGHPAPLVLGTGVGAVEIDGRARGPVLGVLDDATWDAEPIDLGAEWVVAVFTDGLVEGRIGEGDDRLGVEGLRRFADDAMTSTTALSSLAGRLVSAAADANGGPLPDDVALFLVATGAGWRP